MEEQILKFSQLSLLITAKGDKDDKITCSILCGKNIIFGTAHGRVFVTDFNGTITSELSNSKTSIRTALLPTPTYPTAP